MVWESGAVDSDNGEMQKYVTLATDRLKFGADKVEVVKQLVDMGLDAGAARGIVEKIAQRTGVTPVNNNRTIAQRSRDSRRAVRPVVNVKPTSKIKVLIVAGSAAIVGAFCWSFVTNLTGYEIGYVAWGVGLLVGLAVMAVSNGEDNVVIPLISAAAALFGVALGKYLAFFPLYNDELQALATLSDVELAEFDIDPEYLAQMPMLDPATGMSVFLEYGLEFGIYDVLWVFLAVSTAYGIAAYDND